MHYGCIPRICSHVLWMRQECLTGAPQLHFEHTMGAPEMPHASFTDSPRILLDVPGMLYGYSPMHHGRLTDTFSPWMYHGFSTHALLTLKLGHYPWTLLFIYLFVYLFSS